MNPKNIQFSCPVCGYFERARGKAWQSKKPYYGFNTLVCYDCNRISEVVSEKGEPNFSNGVVTWNYLPLASKCGWCESLNVAEWSRENQVCPKCNNLMVAFEKCEFKKIGRISGEDFEKVSRELDNLIVMVDIRNNPLGSITLPFFDEVLVEYGDMEGRILLLEDDEASERLSKAYRIQTLPTFIVFTKGIFKGSFIGSWNKQELYEEIGVIIDRSN